MGVCGGRCTFVEERAQVRLLREDAVVGDRPAVGDDLVELVAQALDYVGAAAKLPEHEPKRRGRGVDPRDAGCGQKWGSLDVAAGCEDK